MGLDGTGTLEEGRKWALIKRLMLEYSMPETQSWMTLVHSDSKNEGKDAVIMG